jgi:hypothetical protein
MSFRQLVLREKQKLNQKEWYPPGWYYNKYSLKENLDLARNLGKEKKSLLSEEDFKILNNEKIIRSCYCTTDIILKLSSWFIGKFDLDPFYNPHALTSLYSEKNFKFFDGINGDGFDIKLWKTYKKVWVNPPFSRLKEAAEKVLEFIKENPNSRVAFICNLDMTSYFEKFLGVADYMIILDRVKFIPIPGLKVSQPTTSNALFIFNSEKNLETGKIKIGSSEFYCVNLKNKKVTVIE